MGFILKRDGWNAASLSSHTTGVMVLDMQVSGFRALYSTVDLLISEFAGSSKIQCTPALLSEPSFVQSVDPYSRQFNPSNMSFVIMTKYFPIIEAINSGQSFNALTAKVYWVLSENFDLSQSFLLVDGVVDNFSYNEMDDSVSFNVIDAQLTGDRQFPPHVITTDNFTGIAEDSYGKVFPVVIGNVVKMPVIDLSVDRGKFLVVDDIFSTYTGVPITGIYDNDEPLVIDSQGSEPDANGDPYWYVVLDVVSDSKDVTVDLTGPSGNLIDAIIYLLHGFSGKQDFFDLTSLRHLSREFNVIQLSAVFNSVVAGGVIQIIKERLIKELPLTIIQRGRKLFFQSLLWDRDVRKYLTPEKNIIQMTSPPSEIERSQMSNSFVVNCGVSGLRGDALSAIMRNKNNDANCYQSFIRYGELGNMAIDIPDVADDEGARWLMNWMVDTYSKTRIRVSYFCTFEVIDLNLWDTVRVFDADQKWYHGPLFKIVGIQLGQANGIVLNLLSVDDAFAVYGVNKNNNELFEAGAPFFPLSFTLSEVSL
jgi:hypothetical protein